MNFTSLFFVSAKFRPVALKFFCFILFLNILPGTTIAQGPDPSAMDIAKDPRNLFSDLKKQSASDLPKTLKFINSKYMEKNSFDSHNEKKRELIGAIGNDDVERVEELIKSNSGIGVNSAIDKGGLTPLMISRSPEMTRKLLELGADPNQTDNCGMTAIHHMLFANNAEELVTVLINSGANVNAVAAGANRETPLLAAKQLFFEGGDIEHGKRIIKILHAAGS